MAGKILIKVPPKIQCIYVRLKEARLFHLRPYVGAELCYNLQALTKSLRSLSRR